MNGNDCQIIKPLYPAKLAPLFEPHSYKILYGGRGGAKSWGIARALISLSIERKLRILCTREFQNSISDSVHKLISDQVQELNLNNYFRIYDKSIKTINGSEFLFRGLARNIDGLKSFEGADICWVEEAQTVSERSWEKLLPTIRKDGAEIWVSLNPDEKEDATYQRFIVHTPPEAILININWYDNPWFPSFLNKQRLQCKNTQSQDKYDNIWNGIPKRISDAIVFKGKYEITPFETPQDAIFYHGCDWGFSVDPSALVRCFVVTDGAYQDLYIDREVYGIGVELEELPSFFSKIETARNWPVYADSARPDTISHMQKHGFPRMVGANKAKGSVEDGVERIRGFRKVIIHPRCRNTADEFRNYSYKVDKNENILPILVDSHNHIIDSLRYALNGYIKPEPVTTNVGRYYA